MEESKMQTLVIAQIFSALSCIICLYAIIVNFRENSSKGNDFFGMSLCFTFVYCIANTFKFSAQTSNAIINSIRLANFCKILLVVFFTCFFIEYNHMKLHKGFKLLYLILNICIAISSFMFPISTIYYRDARLYLVNGPRSFRPLYGPMFYIFVIEASIAVLSFIVLFVYKWSKEKNRTARKKNLCILLSMIFPIIGVCLERFFHLHSYGILSLCFSITCILILIAIRKYHMFDIDQNSSEYVLDNVKEAVIILNSEDEIVYFNTIAKNIYPFITRHLSLADIVKNQGSDNQDESKLLKDYQWIQDYMLNNPEEKTIIDPEKANGKTNGKKEKFSKNETAKHLSDGYSSTSYQSLASTEDTTYHDLDVHGNHQYRFHYKDKDYQFNMTYLYRSDHSISGHLIEITDITEEIRLREKFAELAQKAEMANKSKSDFLANMSHEIRTPINAILGMDEMILREGKEKSIKEYADNIQIAGLTLLNLVNDILDYSKLESGKMNLIESDYQSREIFQSVYEKIKIRQPYADSFVRIHVNPNFPITLYGDRNRMEQYLINICLVALKYSETKQIDFTIDYELLDDAFSGKKSCYVILSFKDHDKPIQKGAHEGLSNIPNAPKDLSKDICDLLMEIMAGHKEEIETKDGFDYRFVLPQGVINSAPIDISEITEHNGMLNASDIFEAPDKKVLVVDDNAVNLKVMQGLLKRTRVNAFFVKSGQECLDIVKKETFDLIFMDHLMPGMDGIETFEALKNLPAEEYRQIPVIILTANAITGAKEMYLNKGFSDYLMKPVNGKELEKMMRQYLS